MILARIDLFQRLIIGGVEVNSRVPDWALGLFLRELQGELSSCYSYILSELLGRRLHQYNLTVL